MIGSCFRKFPRYVRVLLGCKNIEHLARNARAIQFHHVNLAQKRVSSSTAACFYPKTGTKNSYSTVSDEVRVDNAETDFIYHLQQDDIINQSFSTRNILYPESTDEVIVKLKLCDSCDVVLDTIQEIAHPKPEYLVQALLVLRDLCRVDYLYDDDAFNDLKENSSFNQLIEKILDCATQLTVDELSCCILYTHKFGVDESKVIHLITTFEEKIKAMDIDAIPIESLCRVCACVKEFQNIWAMNTFLNFLPLITKKLDSCENITDFRKITGCLKKMYPLCSNSLMKTYVDRSLMLLARKEDPIAECERVITVVRCISFLSHKVWDGDYVNFSVDLLQSLQGRTHLLAAEDQYIVYFVAYDLQEPYQILRELKSTVQRKLMHVPEDTSIDLRSAALLYMHAGSKDVSEMECASSMLTYVDSIEINNEWQFYRTMHYITLLHVGQKLKEELLDKYWNQIINLLERRCCSQTYSLVIDACFSYLKFNSQTKYQHKKFESNAIKWLNQIRNNQKIYQHPFEKCMVDLQLLYYKCGHSEDLESICEYFVENASRLESHEGWFMTFILCNTAARIVRSKNSSSFFRHYVHMLSALNNAAIEFLKLGRNERVNNLVHLFRSYSYGNRSKNTELYRLIIDRLNGKSIEDLNLKRILSVIPSAYRSQSLEPSLVDKMVQYNVQRKNTVTGFSVIQLLNYLMAFGYTPLNCDEFVNVASQVLLREKDELAAPGLVNAVLSLCYYNHLPRELSDHVFSVDFLNSIDRGLPAMTQVRSRRLHDQLMQLNRTVCLDFPHIETSWFHDRYCHEKMITSQFFLKSESQKEIEEALKKLISNEKALEIDCHSPYYHRIDFLLHTNKQGEPVDPNTYRSRDLRKTAILVNLRKTSSPYYLGKGKMDMTIRQLEKLEYKVAVVEGYQWNCMFMSEPTAKETYLCDLIWSKWR